MPGGSVLQLSAFSLRVFCSNVFDAGPGCQMESYHCTVKKSWGKSLCLSLTPSISSKRFISRRPLKCYSTLPMPNLEGELLLFNKAVTLELFSHTNIFIPNIKVVWFFLSKSVAGVRRGCQVANSRTAFARENSGEGQRKAAKGFLLTSSLTCWTS